MNCLLAAKHIISNILCNFLLFIIKCWIIRWCLFHCLFLLKCLLLCNFIHFVSNPILQFIIYIFFFDTCTLLFQGALSNLKCMPFKTVSWLFEIYLKYKWSWLLILVNCPISSKKHNDNDRVFLSNDFFLSWNYNVKLLNINKFVPVWRFWQLLFN